MPEEPTFNHHGEASLRGGCASLAGAKPNSGSFVALSFLAQTSHPSIPPPPLPADALSVTTVNIQVRRLNYLGCCRMSFTSWVRMKECTLGSATCFGRFQCKLSAATRAGRSRLTRLSNFVVHLDNEAKEEKPIKR